MYRIYDLKCNGMTDPVGIDDVNPRFSWRLATDRSGEDQTGYQIILCDDEGMMIWEHKSDNESTVGLRYNGPSLEAHRRYCWSVCSHSTKGDAAESEKAFFSLGNTEKDWTAKWITDSRTRKPVTDCTEMWKVFAGMVGSNPHPEEILNPAVCIRREFTVTKTVRYAVAYASALGIYALSVDGQTISERLAPGYTTYSKYLEIQQYDVTRLLTLGPHAICVELADGWYTGKIGLPGVGEQYGDHNAFYLQLEIFYEDGSRDRLISDEGFRWHESPLEYADLFVGERCRQGFLDEGWMLPGYDDSDWQPVTETEESTDVFRGREADPVRVIRKIRPQLIITPSGELIADAGENIVGTAHICFTGEKNTVLRMTHSEVLDRNGNFLMNILGQNKNQEDVYVCSEKGFVDWEPKFTFHGFRYIRIEGISMEQISDISIQVLGTDLEPVGGFICSDPRLNRLQECIFRSQQGNMLSIPTDCPQRERAGWTGDMQVYAPTACFNMDVYSFLRKWLANMRLEQLPDGQIPNVIPSMPSDRLVRNSSSHHICSAAWGDACVIIPYTLYRKYGDEEILKENYSMMKHWTEYVEQQAATSFLKPESEYTPEELERQRYLWNTEFHFGDWLYPSAAKQGIADPMETALKTKEYVAPAMFAYTTSLMERISRVLGMGAEEASYRDLNAHIRAAYADEYIDADGRMPLPLQGLYVLALALDLYPQEKRSLGTAHLAELISENDGCLDTGFVSVGFLLDTLWDNGRQDLARSLLFNTKCPSWLYEVEMGATTIWEAWNAIQPDGTRTNSSYNHFAFGCIGDFIYRRILGIRETEPGYQKVEIRPDLECGLEYAKGRHICPRGEITVEWHIGETDIEIDVTLPPNVTGFLVVGEHKWGLRSGTRRIKVQQSSKR